MVAYRFMNMPVVHRRRPDGTLLPGQPALNPGGRTRAVEELKARYLLRLPEFFEGLIKLTKSKNEATQLAAIKELLDRLLGRPNVYVDAVHTKMDVGAMYLQALQRANGATSNSNSSMTTSDRLALGRKRRGTKPDLATLFATPTSPHMAAPIVRSRAKRSGLSTVMVRTPLFTSIPGP
jgi:hypothetical protein